MPAAALAQERTGAAPADQTLEEYLAERNAALELLGGPLRLVPQAPQATMERLAPLAEVGAEPSPVASLLQLEAPLTPEARSQLEAAGITIEGYLGGTTYLVAVAPRAERGPLAEALDAHVIAASPLAPENKIRPAALEPLEVPRDLEEEVEAPGPPSLTVQFLSVVDEQGARADLERVGVEVIRKLGEDVFVVRGGEDEARAIAALPSVVVVDAAPPPFLPLNATGRLIAETDQAQLFALGGPAPTYGGVTGTGARVGIADSGVDENHDDFDTVDASGGPGASRVYNVRPGSGSHGTHVASIAAGSGVNADANGHPAFALRGHAPKAEIGDYAQMGASVPSHHAALVGDGTDVTNHSYVQSMDGYGLVAQTIDKIVRGDASHDGAVVPARPQVWAAGNNGTLAQYGDEEGYYADFTSAKNTISVGSIDTRDGRVSRYSSLGPEFDGRIKPDVVAPGCNDSIGGAGILAARNDSQGYRGSCGTSMAAPAVSGIIGLMMEGYEDAFGIAPSLEPSTYKAVLVQTARDMVKTAPYASREFDNPDTGQPIVFHAGPDFSTGYGLVDANAAVQTLADASLWKEAAVSSTGAVDTWCVDVPAGAAEIKASLAWDDEPGSTITSITMPKLVNDLDLELVAPDGSLIRPWTLDPLPLTANPGDGAQDPIATADVVPAHRGVDRRNNVEMAHLPLPQAGEWKIRVRAFNLPNGNAQSYALVTSQPFKAICRTGPVIAVPICERYPGICRGRWDEPIPREGIDWRIPVRIDDICKYVINCPGCDRVAPGSYCPGWRLDLEGLPRDALVTVFDEAGEIVYSNGRGSKQSILVDERRPGSERFVFVAGPDGRPYEEPFNPKVVVRPLDR